MPLPLLILAAMGGYFVVTLILGTVIGKALQRRQS